MLFPGRPNGKKLTRLVVWGNLACPKKNSVAYLPGVTFVRLLQHETYSGITWKPANEMRLQKTPWPRKSQNKKLFRYIVRQQNDHIRINDNLSFIRIFCLHTTIKIDILFVPNEMSEQSLPYPQLKLMQQAFYRHWSSDQGVVWKPSTVEIVEQAGCQYSGPP